MSNLPFISKVLEKIVPRQLSKHLSDKSLLQIHQSTYRKDHSTGTAVLSVLDCLLAKAEERLVSLIALLDLSVAFNTLDHFILLKRLEVSFEVRDIALEWFAFCLSVSLLSLMALCLLQALLFMKYPGILFWDLSCSRCTPSLCRT